MQCVDFARDEFRVIIINDMWNYGPQFDVNICIGRLCPRVSVEFVVGGIFGLPRGK